MHQRHFSVVKESQNITMILQPQIQMLSQTILPRDYMPPKLQSALYLIALRSTANLAHPRCAIYILAD